MYKGASIIVYGVLTDMYENILLEEVGQRLTALYGTCCICTRCRTLLHSAASTNLYVQRHQSDSQS